MPKSWSSLQGQKFIAIVVACLISSIAYGQWLNYPTPGIPRTSDGTPNLFAPAPKTPDGRLDLSGIWGSIGRPPDVKDIPLHPAARALVEAFAKAQNNKDSGLAQCLPHVLVQIVPVTLYKIVQTPGLMVMLFDTQGMPLPRQVFTDGRPLPDDPSPSWLGYSVGHWEQNTLVVETAGFNSRVHMPLGIPVTEKSRITERYQRPDFGHLKVEITVEDPQTFAKPWTFNLDAQLRPDTELLEYVCEKNDDILRHMIGPR